MIDCFIFLNEFDILEARLDYLDSVVDYFVIVESNITFSGNKKPLYFCENQMRYSKFKHKIIYYPFIFDNSIHNFDFTFDENQVYADYATAQWQVEYMQRNHIANAVKLVDGNPFIILGDVDEIPDKAAIEFAKNNLYPDNPVAAFITKLFFYNLYTMDSIQWPSIVFTTKDFLLEKTPQYLRSNHRNQEVMPQISNAGWHLSYFGGPSQIQFKINSYSHQENNKETITNYNNILDSINNGVSIFSKDIKYLQTTREIFPADFLKSFSIFLNE